ncbi:MAG TPA: metallophosphatase [Bacteroidia bacterium]|jgi:5'-nucleotidase|nr:metallophosphatase [Bacteroidia bacterium]
MSQSRRDFLKLLSGGTALLGLGMLNSGFRWRKNDDVDATDDDHVRIVILHTNDVHSHIDPFPDNDPKYPGLGGVERRAALIDEIRAQEKNVLLLDAGDIFQGTPYFNMYLGEVEMKLMSKMGYEASTVGNHDFDAGLDNLATQLQHATFPLLCANYDFTGTPMEGKTIPYKIFEKEGVKIGVFGLGIELAGLVDSRLYGKTVYQDPIVKAAEMVKELRDDQKCDIVVCLSHLGYKYENDKVSDIKLAKESRGIDVIIGGHTHTFLDKPAVFSNREGKDCYVAQVGWAGIRLGKIIITTNKKSGKKSLSSSTVIVRKKSSV